MEPTTAADLDPSQKDGPNGQQEINRSGKPEPHKQFGQDHEDPESDPTTDPEFKKTMCVYNSVADNVAGVIQKFVDAGMNGKDSGDLALEILKLSLEK